MSCYINDHYDKLNKRHYLRKASVEHYWDDFTYNRVKELFANYGENFRLIIYASLSYDDCYVMPYSGIKSVFLEEALDNRGRWSCQITDQVIHVGKKPHIKEMDIRRYYNNFDPLLSKRA